MSAEPTSGRRRWRSRASLPTKAATVVAAAVLALVVLTQPAAAHTGEQSYVYIAIEDADLSGTVQFPVDDLNEVLDLDIPTDRREAGPVVEANLDEVVAYAASSLAMSADGRDWPVRFDGDFRILDTENGIYVVVPFTVDHGLGEIPQRFTVEYDGIIGDLDDKDAVLLIATDWQGGVFDNEADGLLRYTSDNTVQVVDRDASFWTGFTAVVGLGIDHIEIGTDHILFVLALLIPAVLTFRRGEGWFPTRSFGSGLWRVTKIATMFTIAHSITLSLGGLGIVELPARPVETFIALSIAAAAAHNVYPVFGDREWLLAFAFGLFHGLGFAGLLSDLGLTDTNQFWSLLGFNVGIELGQLVIIFLVFPVLFVLRRTLAYPFVLYGASGLLALAAVGWAAERGLQVTERVSDIVDPVFEWPRAFWVILVAFALAAIYNRAEAARGRLRSTDDVLPGPAIQRRGAPERDDSDRESETVGA